MTILLVVIVVIVVVVSLYSRCELRMIAHSPFFWIFQNKMKYSCMNLGSSFIFRQSALFWFDVILRSTQSLTQSFMNYTMQSSSCSP